MRFLIEYKDYKNKETENQSLHLLETFLNEHLIGTFHGNTFECILIRFIQNSPPKRKLKLKSLYKTIAEIELNGDFRNTSGLDLEGFQQGLFKVAEAIKKVTLIKLKEPLNYQEEKLFNDYKNALQVTPKTYGELMDYAKNEQKIKLSNQANRADCLNDETGLY